MGRTPKDNDYYNGNNKADMTVVTDVNVSDVATEKLQ